MSELLRSTPTDEIVKEINFQGGVNQYVRALKQQGKPAPSVATITRWLKAQGYETKRTYVRRSEPAVATEAVQA